jgi:hypothetical protein
MADAVSARKRWGAGAVRPDVDMRDLLGLVCALARAADRQGRSAADENRLLMLALTGIVTRPPAAPAS